jgi:hypothetical protein
MIANLLNRACNDLRFEMNGNVYLSYYLLVDGIYFMWSYFVQTLHEPQDENKKHFANIKKAQEKM